MGWDAVALDENGGPLPYEPTKHSENGIHISGNPQDKALFEVWLVKHRKWYFSPYFPETAENKVYCREAGLSQIHIFGSEIRMLLQELTGEPTYVTWLQTAITSLTIKWWTAEFVQRLAEQTNWERAEEIHQNEELAHWWGPLHSNLEEIQIAIDRCRSFIETCADNNYWIEMSW